MVAPDGPGKHHSDEIGREHRLAIGPGGKRSQGEQADEQKFGFEFGRPLPIPLEHARCKPGKNYATYSGDPRENRGLHGKRRENQAERQYGSKISDETSAKEDLAEIGVV